MGRVIGNRVPLNDHVWTVWSEAPGVGCFWLTRRDDEGKAVFIKARRYKDEWRDASDQPTQ